MAQVIDSLERRSRYPWKTWTDGQPRAAVRGTDFKCSVDGFRTSLYSFARRNKRKVVVAYKGDCVEFQFNAPRKKAKKATSRHK